MVVGSTDGYVYDKRERPCSKTERNQPPAHSESKKIDTAWSFSKSEASSNYMKVTHHNHVYYVTVISSNKAHHV